MSAVAPPPSGQLRQVIPWHQRFGILRWARRWRTESYIRGYLWSEVEPPGQQTFIENPDGGHTSFATNPASATIVAIFVPTASGGATTSGAATVSARFVITPSGGIVLNGSAPHQFIPNPPPAGGNWISSPASLWWRIPDDIRDRMLRWGTMPERVPEPVDGKRTKEPKRGVIKRKLQIARARLIQQARLLPKPRVYWYEASGGPALSGKVRVARRRTLVAMSVAGPVFKGGGEAEVSFFRFTPAHVESLQREDEILLTMLD